MRLTNRRAGGSGPGSERSKPRAQARFLGLRRISRSASASLIVESWAALIGFLAEARLLSRAFKMSTTGRRTGTGVPGRSAAPESWRQSGRAGFQVARWPLARLVISSLVDSTYAVRQIVFSGRSPLRCVATGWPGLSPPGHHPEERNERNRVPARASQAPVWRSQPRSQLGVTSFAPPTEKTKAGR